MSKRIPTLCWCGHFRSMPHVHEMTARRRYRPRLVKQRALLLTALCSRELGLLREYVADESSTAALNRIARDISIVRRRFAEAGLNDVRVEFRVELP